MTATNHALTGALIGFTVHPLLVVPAAFISHFVLDALPHFGFRNLNERGKRFGAMLLTDIFLCYLLVAALVITQPHLWYMAAVGAFVAASPDFMWAPDYIRTLRGVPERGLTGPLKRFHSNIQWFQRPSGAFIELFFGLVLLYVLASYL